jgi:hypothetical protein
MEKMWQDPIVAKAGLLEIAVLAAQPFVKNVFI